MAVAKRKMASQVCSHPERQGFSPTAGSLAAMVRQRRLRPLSVMGSPGRSKRTLGRLPLRGRMLMREIWNHCPVPLMTRALSV